MKENPEPGYNEVQCRCLYCGAAMDVFGVTREECPACGWKIEHWENGRVWYTLKEKQETGWHKAEAGTMLVLESRPEL